MEEKKDKPEVEKELDKKSGVESGSKKKLMVIGVVAALVAVSLAWMLFLPAETPGGDNGINDPPVVTVTWEDDGGDGSVTIREIVYFNVTATDPEGESLNYKWDFDDSDGIQVEATSESTFHTYSEIGNKRITVNVSDGLEYTVKVIDITVDAGDLTQITLMPTAYTYDPPGPGTFHGGYNINIDSISNQIPLGEVNYYLVNTTTNQTIRSGVTSSLLSPQTLAGVYFIDTDANENITADDRYQINDPQHITINAQPYDAFILAWNLLDENKSDQTYPSDSVIGCILLNGLACPA